MARLHTPRRRSTRPAALGSARGLLAFAALVGFVGLVGACGESRREPAPTAARPGATEAPGAPSALAAPGPAADPRIAAAAAAGRRVVFVGLDGADWELLDPYMAGGVMPNLAALVRGGRGGVLTTIHPPLSPLVWTTMMTGVGPLEHGVLDFTRFNPRTGAREPIGSAERRVPAIWNMATAAGRSVAVLGLWATYPAEPVRGVVVSDRLFSFAFGEAEPPPGAVYPAGREAWARRALAAAEAATGYPALHAYFPWLGEDESRRILAEPNAFAQPVSALRRILVETAVYHRLAADLLARQPPDLTVLYIQGTDAIGHLFAPYAPPRLPRVSHEDFARYGDVPRRYFAAIDALLGDMRRLAERSGAVLVIASDHGFRWRDRPDQPPSFAAATAGRWHREEGISLLWGPGVEPAMAGGGHGDRASVRQVCATLLALLGLPPDPRLAGPPLAGVAAPPRAAVHYERDFRPAAGSASAGSAAAGGHAPAPAAGAGAGSAEAVARLRALGYVGAGEPARAPVGPPAGGDPTRTADSYDNEGLILREAGRAADARAAFARAIARDPQNASALWNLSDLLAAGSPAAADLDRADRLLAQALAAGLPDGAARLRERALRYAGAGAGERSVRLLAAATAARPTDPEIWLLAGRYRVERRDCRAALADFEHAERLAPGNALAYGSSALARLCLGDAPGAAEDLRRSLALDPEQPEVRRALAGIEHPP
jgi:tetratricopeptide (TPR) repeat protein